MEGKTPISRIPIPREHGAWAMLIGAALIAWAHPGVVRLPAVVLVLLFVLAFAVQEPLRAIAAGRPGPWQRWAAAYVALLLVGATWLVVAHSLWVVIPAAVLGLLGTAADLAARRRKVHRSLPARALGSGAITFVLPATIWAMHPSWAGYALVLWAMIVAHFMTRLLLIRSRIARGRSEDKHRAWRRAAVWSQVPLYAGLGLLTTSGLASVWALAAFVPGTVTTLLPERDMSMRRSGLIESLILLWFVSAVVVSYHVGDVPMPPA